MLSILRFAAHWLVVVTVMAIFIGLGGIAEATPWDDAARAVAVEQWGPVCDGDVGLTSDDLPSPLAAQGIFTVAEALWDDTPTGKTNCGIVFDRTQVALLDYPHYCTYWVHEAGHLGPWGYEHSDDPASVMFFAPRVFSGCLPPAPVATPVRRYPAGCLTRQDVNVGYYPYILTAAADLHTSPHAGSTTRHAMRAGARFAVQSSLNPQHTTDPGEPQPVNGYVWGYAKRGGRSGWIIAAVLELDTSGDNWAEGPAGLDFQVGYGVPDADPGRRFVLGARVSGVGTVTDATVYQRWAASSSPMALLLRGEHVRLLWRASGSFCVVAPDGRRGWLPATAIT